LPSTTNTLWVGGEPSVLQNATGTLTALSVYLIFMISSRAVAFKDTICMRSTTTPCVRPASKALIDTNEGGCPFFAVKSSCAHSMLGQAAVAPAQSG